jgi:hypothetical protein
MVLQPRKQTTDSPTLQEALGQAGLPVPETKVAGQAFSQQLDAQLRGLIRVLRSQPGIPVRQPSHIVNPFRAVPIQFGYTLNIAGPGGAPGSFVTATLPVIWTAQADPGLTGLVGNVLTDTAFLTVPSEPFPEGFAGVLTRVQVWAAQINTNANVINVTRSTRWSIRLRDTFLTGFQSQLVSVYQQMPAVFAGVIPISGVNIDTSMRTHITLRPGDTLAIDVSIANDVPANITVSATAIVEGYMYPAGNVSDQIETTLTD